MVGYNFWTLSWVWLRSEDPIPFWSWRRLWRSRWIIVHSPLLRQLSVRGLLKGSGWFVIFNSNEMSSFIPWKLRSKVGDNWMFTEEDESEVLPTGGSNVDTEFGAAGVRSITLGRLSLISEKKIDMTHMISSYNRWIDIILIPCCARGSSGCDKVFSWLLFLLIVGSSKMGGWRLDVSCVMKASASYKIRRKSVRAATVNSFESFWLWSKSALQRCSQFLSSLSTHSFDVHQRVLGINVLGFDQAGLLRRKIYPAKSCRHCSIDCCLTSHLSKINR